MKKEERVGRMILQRIAANGEDERREGRGRNGGGWGGEGSGSRRDQNLYRRESDL